MGGTRPGRRVTQREAAEIMGVSVEAIRKRVKRGTLRSEKGGDGRRYVYLDPAPDDARPQRSYDHAGQAYPQAEGRRHADPAPLVEELRDRLRYVETQLQAEREAHAESRRLLLAALEKIPPAIEPPGEPPAKEPSEATPQPGRVGPQPAVESTQEPREESGMHMPEAGGGPLPHDQQTPSARPWWRRVLGG